MTSNSKGMATRRLRCLGHVHIGHCRGMVEGQSGVAYW